jgi:hypothetical protein
MADRSKTGLKKCPENDHSKTGWSGIRSFTVLVRILIYIVNDPYYRKCILSWIGLSLEYLCGFPKWAQQRYPRSSFSLW